MGGKLSGARISMPAVRLLGQPSSPRCRRSGPRVDARSALFSLGPLSASQRTAVYSEKIAISTRRSTRVKPASVRAERMTGGATQLSIVSQ